MSKKDQLEATSFGKRLAMIRKAAGYTQQELAKEIGVTRRVIAYYEAESQQPPANLLADLSKALNISIDQLLGVNTKNKDAIPKLGNRLERRLKQIEKLHPKAKRQIIQFIDTCIEAERLRKNIEHGS
jgi:transcriptional regulator with XRE-family HTH domain